MGMSRLEGEWSVRLPTYSFERVRFKGNIFFILYLSKVGLGREQIFLEYFRVNAICWVVLHYRYSHVQWRETLK